MRNLDVDKSICNWIKNKQFSRLGFLEGEWQSTENRSYMGYYYFVLDLKEEANDFILDELIKREGSKVNALIFLGNIANKIYDTSKNQVCISFFRKALEEDSSSSEANWLVYHYTYCIQSFLETLKIDYKNKCYHVLNTKANIFDNFEDLSTLSISDLDILKNILTDSQLNETDNIRSILSVIHYEFNELEIGLEYLRKSEKIPVEVVKLYYEKNLISLDEAISKIYDFQVERIIGDDASKIYEVYLELSKKGEPNPTKDLLIKKAFMAEKYQDIINIFEIAEANNEIFYDLGTYLFYLLSQLELDQKLNPKTLDYINQKFDFFIDLNHSEEEKFLYCTLMIKLQIIDIKKLIALPDGLNFPIDMYSSYQKAQKILEFPEMIKSNNYEKFKKELNELKNSSDFSQKLKRFNEHSQMFKLENFDHESLINYCNLCIELNKYDLVIENLENFHQKKVASMSSYNCLGVAYQRKKNYYKALENYKLALDIMIKSKDNDYIVIQNYIDIYNYVEVDIDKEEYDNLRNLLNIGLTNRFKWHDFYTDRFNTLYKYYPFNVNTIDALTNQYFFLPSKWMLNDPIELPDISKIRSNNHILDNYNICSFSNNENSMLMWSHYAQQHEGIMVEYFFGGELPSGFGISKVSYADDEKRYKDKDEFIFNQFLLTKNKDWSYEREVRLFTFLNNKVEFETYKYPNPDRKKINASIKCITLGLNFPEEKKKLIGIIVNTLNSRKLPHESKILVKQAFLRDENNYSLEYRVIA
ncbi:TPA: DUF2971 domain-containing protein [Acinetobacter baumannii]|nr:DUF2971 domain-containing protein [Acinetobacter baumannii]